MLINVVSQPSTADKGSPMGGQVAVLGIGNILMRDDGAGPRVIALLQQDPGTAEGLLLLDGGTLSFTLLHPLQTCCRLVVVDSALLGLKPGTLSCFEGEAMDAFLRSGRRSAHEVGLADLLDMARLLGVLPPQRALVVIQAADISLGDTLSLPVARAIPYAAQRVRQTVQTWLSPVVIPLSGDP